MMNIAISQKIPNLNDIKGWENVEVHECSEKLIDAGKSLSDEELIASNNRRLLFHVMNKVGFTNYPDEWWHYDYGNQLWGKVKGKHAMYGKIALQN